MSVTTEQSAAASAIRPFQVDVADEALEDLRRRIEATNWPEKETVADQSQGVPLTLMQELALLGDRVRLAQVRSGTEGPAALHDRD
jgi:Epoxide hydrolase N terminus